MAHCYNHLERTNANMKSCVEQFKLNGVVKTSDLYCAGGTFTDIWDCRLGTRRVAVKVIRCISFDPEARRDFKEQLQRFILSWMGIAHRHPNVVPLLGYTNDFGHLPALVSPFYPNGTMWDYIFNSGVNKTELLAEAAAGMEFLHEEGVVHGDFRASRVMIDDNGHACITDMGLSSIILQSVYTAPNSVGQCRWMAPELFEHNDKVDGMPTSASDVWAFGMTILEVFTEKRPFSHIRRDVNVIFDILHGGLPPRPPNDRMSDKIWDACVVCWDRNPVTRVRMWKVREVLQVLACLETLDETCSI